MGIGAAVWVNAAAGSNVAVEASPQLATDSSDLYDLRVKGTGGAFEIQEDVSGLQCLDPLLNSEELFVPEFALFARRHELGRWQGDGAKAVVLERILSSDTLMIRQEIESSFKLSQMEYLLPLVAKLGRTVVLESGSRKSLVAADLEASNGLSSVGARVVVHASLVEDSESFLVGNGANCHFEASLRMLSPVLGSCGAEFGMSEGSSRGIFLIELCLLKTLEVDGSHLE